jgi:hypothetical protein
LLVSPRARSCKPSQISRKNYIGNTLAGPCSCHTEIMRAYHIVAPVTHCPFEIVCAAVRFAKALKALYTEQLFLFLLGDTAHCPTQRCGHGEVRFQIALKPLMELVEDGNLDVYQKGKFLAKRRQGSVSICTSCVSKV